MKFISKVNGYKTVDLNKFHEVAEAEKEKQKKLEADKKYTVIDVLKHPRLLKHTLLLGWIW